METTRDFATTNEMTGTVTNQSPLSSLGRWLEYGFGFGRVRAHWEDGGAADLGNLFGHDKLDRASARGPVATSGGCRSTRRPQTVGGRVPARARFGPRGGEALPSGPSRSATEP